MTEQNGHFHRITRTNEEAECEYCGFPMYVGDRVFYTDGDERAYCGRVCAHRDTGRDEHRRRITEDERAAFYSQAKQTSGRARVPIHAEQTPTLNYDWRMEV